MECFQNLKFKKTDIKEHNRELIETQAKLQRDLNEKDAELNSSLANIREINSKLNDLQLQKKKLFFLMDDWNDNTIPNEKYFLIKITTFRNDIVDFTRQMDEHREDINLLKEAYYKQTQEIEKNR